MSRRKRRPRDYHLPRNLCERYGIGNMVTLFILMLLATRLGAGPPYSGLLEGAAVAAAVSCKLRAGRCSDIKRGTGKMLMVDGYGLSNLASPFWAPGSSWGHFANAAQSGACR